MSELSPELKMAAYFLGRRIAGQRKKTETWLLLYEGEITTSYSANAGTAGDGNIDHPYGSAVSYVDGNAWEMGDTVRVTFDGVQSTHTVHSSGMSWFGSEYLMDDMETDVPDDGGEYACRLQAAARNAFNLYTRAVGTYNVKIERLVSYDT